MKLTKFNRGTTLSSNRADSLPIIGVNQKGLIRLNKAGQKLLGLAINDRVNILQDEEKPSDWYVEKTTDDDGFILRNCSGGGLLCNSVLTTNKIMDSLRIQKSTLMRIAPKPIEDGSSIYAILTSTARK